MTGRKSEGIRDLIKAVSVVMLLFGVGIALYLLLPDEKRGELAIYRTVDGVDLTLTIYRPDDWAASDRRPCVVWFFGGGWEVGGPSQFSQNAEQLAEMGFVSITPDYRVRSRHGSEITPLDSATDAMASMSWIRAHAADLGIDSNRIAAGGGSSGGHLATYCAVNSAAAAGHAEQASHVPNALLLYNPVLDFEVPFVRKRASSAEMELLSTISPVLLLKDPLPPTLILHGNDDRIIPVQTSVDFVTKAETLGSKRIELIRYPRRSHEFYLHGPGARRAFKESMGEVIRFLTELGWMEMAIRNEARQN